MTLDSDEAEREWWGGFAAGTIVGFAITIATIAIGFLIECML